MDYGTKGNVSALSALGRSDGKAGRISLHARQHGGDVAADLFEVDLEDLRLRTEELAGFIADSAARYKFDPSRLVAVGYSNGANIAGSLLLSHPGVLAGGILLRPMVPFEPDTLPDLSGTHVLLSAGRHDPLIPPPSTERLKTLLEGSKADVTLTWHEAGHSLLPREMEQAARWFGQHFS
jgi:phospholipase/carboxylesterase/glyoxalase family protein